MVNLKTVNFILTLLLITIITLLGSAVMVKVLHEPDTVGYEAVITEISGSSLRLNHLRPINPDRNLYANRSDFRTREPRVGDVVYVIPKRTGNLYIQTLFQ